MTNQAPSELPHRQRSGAVDVLIKGEVTPVTLKGSPRHAIERPRVTAIMDRREATLRAIVADSADVILLLDANGTIIFASGSVQQVDGYDPADLLGGLMLDRIHPDDLRLAQQHLAECMRCPGARTGRFEYRQERADGTWRDREAVAVNRLAEPDVSAIVVTYRDVTERNVAQAEQAHLATIVDSSDDAIYSRTLEGIILSWNRGAERLLGYSAEEAVGQHVSRFFAAESRVKLPGVFDSIGKGHSVRQLQMVCARKDGGEVPVSLTVSPVRDRSGRVVASATVARDISRQLATQKALADSEAEHRATFEDAPVGMAQAGLDGRWLRVNHCLRAMLGYCVEELQAMTLADVTHPDDADDDARTRLDLLAGITTEYRGERRYLRKDGSLLWVNLRINLHRSAAGEPAHFIAVVEDISQRKKAELQLDHIFNLSPDMIATANFEGYFTRVNSQFRQVLGYDTEMLTSRPFISFVHPDDRASTLEALQQLTIGERVFGFTNRYRTADGSYLWLEWHSKADPATRTVYAVARDQTSRRLLENQLRQSQKMEAVGRLAGGVAHDFNNLLTAIIGFSEMAMADLPPDATLHDDLAQILNAGRSAASLTSQLLAFSRKQILQPQVLDVQELLHTMYSLLRRVIGEHIVLDLAGDGGAHHISADRGQLEQVIMNLAVNARDAMPSGGTLRIATDAVLLDDAFVATHPGSAAGPHVRVSIVDTGVGMEPAVQAQLFEPFFTTKEHGKGTGLGLATVYGIVKQSGGYIGVKSAPGQGAAFTLYLPAVANCPVDPPVAAETSQVSGSETIMVVEDQREVRAVVRQALQASGYRVLEVVDGPAALALIAGTHEPVHLLLTDVVMPLMSGRELARRASAMCPNLRVLYMSGYTDDTIVHHGVLEPDIDFLPKPFRPTQLLERVRALLDRALPAGRVPAHRVS